ncbi:hypothetical protein C8R47DRAFT_1329606 [Mycena vitilis]|nr:hypothetical protein C8R47DRAFT_1329606 [Mycena vitilis]
MLSVWVLLAPVLLAAAGQTNHTIDDASALVRYLPNGLEGMACGACNDTQDWDMDSSQLRNGTFSAFSPGISFGADTGMEFNFTGIGIYVFLAIGPNSNVGTASTSAFEFFVDGVLVGTRNSFPNELQAQYNISGYANNSIPDGLHTFRMIVPSAVIFDYAVYTSNDDEIISSPSSAARPSSTAVLSSTSVADDSYSTGAAHTSSGSIAQKKAPVAAIAGAVAGAIVLIFGAVVGLFLMRRARRTNDRRRHTPSMEEGSAAGLFVPVTTSPAVQEAIAAERYQTRALQGSGRTIAITDTLIHTDSGLRLTAGRAEERGVEELPPMYVAD